MNPASNIHVVSFGCRLNIVESDAMQREAVAAGHRDLTIVNTCAVTAEAARQSRQAVRRAARERPGSAVIVTGCAAEVEADRFKAMPEVAAVLPNRSKADAAVWQALPGAGRFTAGPIPETPEPSSHTRGFVEIQNGCDHRCTFCVIPLGRGRSRSVPAATIVERVRNMVETGSREVVLTGVDITAYADGDCRLGRLLRKILAEVPDLPRLRLSSLDCIEADPDVIGSLAEEPRLMPHLHLSVQAGSDIILKRMARRHRRRDVVRFCETLRAARPDIVFGADLIAGFPTETAAMFADTTSLIAECGLTYIHAFPFSPRPGTAAVHMPAVPAETVKERAGALRECGSAQLGNHLDRHLGRRLTVLSERGGLGHAEDFTRVRLPAHIPAGLFVHVVADHHDGRALDAITGRAGNALATTPAG